MDIDVLQKCTVRAPFNAQKNAHLVSQNVLMHTHSSVILQLGSGHVLTSCHLNFYPHTFEKIIGTGT